MSFVDKVQVTLKAGNGGDGRLSFRREKFIDRGGPDGGDGGNGGDIVALASRNLNTLANFRYQKELKAPAGDPGGKRRKHGKSGEDLIVPLPVGTVVTNNEGDILADLIEDGQKVIIAHGGHGGFGNAHFISSTRQAPRIAEKGEPGDQLRCTFELKVIADVGIVGLPNAGKSTLLSVVSNARPEIADYPFTTITPNLGVVDIDPTHSLLAADIPGLIAGAANGKGLGDDFLRHVERSGVLVHLIDVYQEDIIEAYKTIQQELEAYKVNLAKRPQIVALNKTEGLDTATIAERIKQLKQVVPKGTQIVAIAAQAKQGTTELMRAVLRLVQKERQKQEAKTAKKPALPVFRMPNSEDTWQVQKTDEGFIVTGPKIERFAKRTDFKSEAAIQRLRDIMKRMGILHELARQGAKPDDSVAIHNIGSMTL